MTTPTNSRSEAILNKFTHSISEVYAALEITGPDSLDPLVLEDTYYCASALLDQCLLQYGVLPGDDDSTREDLFLRLAAKITDFNRVALEFQRFSLKHRLLLARSRGLTTHAPGPNIMHLLLRLREATSVIIPGDTLDQFRPR